MTLARRCILFVSVHSLHQWSDLRSDVFRERPSSHRIRRGMH